MILIFYAFVQTGALIFFTMAIHQIVFGLYCVKGNIVNWTNDQTDKPLGRSVRDYLG